MNGREIKEIRTMLFLSQAEFAKKLGVKTGTVSNWENGRNKPGRMSVFRKLRRMKEQVFKDEKNSEKTRRKALYCHK